MFNTVFIKRGAAVGVSALLLITTTVSAQGDRLVRSNGRYSVTPENGSILIDTDDIETNAQAIARLQGQLGGLSFKYATEKDVTGTGDDNKGYYWSLDPDDPTGEKWVKVGAVGSAVSSDVLVGKKFSSEAGVDIEGSMPNPTSANISTTANPTTNLSAGSETVTINNGIDTTEAHDTDVTQINLGVGEQITIPHGYYNKDIVITNGDANRGSSPVYLTAANKSVTLPAGYYDSFTVTTDVTSGGGAIYYHHHVHSQSSTTEYFENQSPAITSEGPADTERVTTSSGCFTKPVYGTKVCGSDYATSKLVHEDREGHYDVTWRCAACGANYRKSGRDIGSGWRCSNSVTDYSKIIGYTTGCGIARGTMIEAVIKYK